VLTIDDDRTRFNLHILPELGHMLLADVQAYHLVDFLGALRRKVGPRKKPLSKNTIRNIWANIVTFFADAEQRGLTLRTPCAGVRKAQRPRKASRAETQGIAFTNEQVSSLVSDERIPEDRRVLYAMMFLMGERFGESAGHRWKDHDPAREPLGHMRLERQYDGKPLKGKRGEGGPPRDIPVHPMLAAILAEWRIGGFPKMFGRHPEPEDLIVPSRRGRCRTLKHGARRLNEDCARVGISWKDATHVARRTFITLAMAGGAGEAWVNRITHNASGDVLTGYQVNHWGAMCEAVLCVKVERRRAANVIELRDYREKRRRAP
jgi:integrase